jgi:hypothetical protein
MRLNMYRRILTLGLRSGKLGGGSISHIVILPSTIRPLNIRISHERGDDEEKGEKMEDRRKPEIVAFKGAPLLTWCFPHNNSQPALALVHVLRFLIHHCLQLQPNGSYQPFLRSNNVLTNGSNASKKATPDLATPPHKGLLEDSSTRRVLWPKCCSA